jgi:hypothetical protein
MMEHTESGMPNPIEDILFQLQALLHVQHCKQCRKQYEGHGSTHFVVWNGDDYITCLRLRDNRFLSHEEFHAYLSELAQLPMKEEHSNEVAANV